MKHKIGVITSLIVTAIAWLTKLYIIFNKENFIIVHGIQKYRSAGICCTVIAIIFSIATILIITLYHRKIKAESIINAEQQVFMEEQQQAAIEEKRQHTSFLSASNKLNENVIRDNLKKSYNNEWKELQLDLTTLYEQSVKMDKLQERLKTLITKNEASVLDDTEDVLEQAEQSLLQNIRKVMNYMDVCDPSIQEEKEKVRTSAIQCKKDNTQIIDNVSDFLMSLTEYLNNQGSNDNLKALNTYKEALISSIPNTDSKEKEKVTLTF